MRAPWNAQFLQEHEQFPLGEHDDVPDAAGWAFLLLYPEAAAGNPRNRALAHFNPWGSSWTNDEDREP